ncbi:MAG: hypothetical protein FWG89_00035 [Treponema sp.]|nr:hypothetical protein [Treponema sp.]
MRAINLANSQKRDAKIGFEPKAKKSFIKMILADGREKNNVQFLKTKHSMRSLLRQYNTPDEIKNAIIQGDPEIDIENGGRLIEKTRRMYVTGANETAYSVSLVQAVYDASGNEIEKRELAKVPSNIGTDIPVKWSGKEFPKEESVRKFVFSKKYQLRHTSGITFDFLYDMAKYLHERNTMMFVGGGKKGNEPLVLCAGGEPYRGFLEGRVSENAYCLILHLSSMEIKQGA